MSDFSDRLRERIPSKDTVKRRCTSVKAWQLPKAESAIAPDYVWTNKDMDPVPPEDQTWTLWTWMAYWATDTVNLGTWETASSIINVGLTWREAIPIMVCGTTCIAIPMVLNGAIGAALHVPFSVIVRSGFGYYFGYFCIISRSILAMFWLGIQGANGAQAMAIMISSIWPSFNDIPDHIGLESQGISTSGMIAYFLFWLIQLPLLLIPPTRLRWLFIIKLIAAPITALATMGWCVHKAHGSGDLFGLKPQVSGSTYTYLWLSCMTAVTGSWATLAVNIPDFSRYAKSSRGQYIQLPFLPIIFTICGVMGIVTTSASIVIWGEALWNPLDIIAHWQAYGHGGRAAAFFAAASWYIAQVGTNVTANSISAANDLTVLFPRYVNIFRGCIIAAVIGGWVIVPWKIIKSSDTFLSFMGGYSVFLAPMAGVMASDYWIVKRRQIDVPALYDPYGRYRYWYGVNWQGFVAFLCAIGPNLPGLAWSIDNNPPNPNPVHVSSGINHLYSFAWLYGFVSSIVIYVTLHKLFPWKASLVEKTIDGVEVAAERKTEMGGAGLETPPEDAEMVKNDEKRHGHIHENRRMSEGVGYANVDPLHHARDVWMKE